MYSSSSESGPINNSKGEQQFREANKRIGEWLISGIATDDPRFDELNRRLDEAAADLAAERRITEPPRLTALARIGLYFGLAYADPYSAKFAKQATQEIDQPEQ